MFAEIRNDIIDKSIIATFRVTQEMMMSLNLDKLDRLLLEECNKSDKASDWLLALETIFRRWEEQREESSGG